MIAHEYEHYAGSGTGLRSLLDTYVYCRKKGDALYRIVRGLVRRRRQIMTELKTVFRYRKGKEN